MANHHWNFSAEPLPPQIIFGKEIKWGPFSFSPLSAFPNVTCNMFPFSFCTLPLEANLPVKLELVFLQTRSGCSPLCLCQIPEFLKYLNPYFEFANEFSFVFVSVFLCFVGISFCVRLQTRRLCSPMCLCQIPEFLPSHVVAWIYRFVFLCILFSMFLLLIVWTVTWIYAAGFPAWGRLWWKQSDAVSSRVCGRVSQSPGWVDPINPSLPTSSLPPHVICLPCFLRILSGYCWYCQLLRLGGRHSIGWPCPLPPPSPLSTTLPRPSPSCPIQNTLHHYTSDISRYAFEDEKSDTTDTVWDIHISKLKIAALDDWFSAPRILCQY